MSDTLNASAGFPLNVFEFNQRAWDQLVTSGNRWTVPVSGEDIAKARRGDWRLVLTPSLPVPDAWFRNQASGTGSDGVSTKRQSPLRAFAMSSPLTGTVHRLPEVTNWSQAR